MFDSIPIASSVIVMVSGFVNISVSMVFTNGSLSLEHYLHSLHKKPGALAGSVALKQSEPGLQDIYHRYYQERAKDFIELLLFMREQNKSLKEIEHAISKLHRIGSSLPR